MTLSLGQSIYREGVKYQILLHRVAHFLHIAGMDIFSFDAAMFLSFLLTLLRVSLIIFVMPFFGGDTIPAMVKASLCIVLTLAIWPRLALPAEAFPAHPAEIIVLVLTELVFGLMLGLCVHFIFAGIQTGGQILGFQMGFTMITLADPSSGANASITSFLLYTVSLMVFLTLDGHLHLVRALSESFRLVPAGGLIVSGRLTGSIISLSGEMFSLALKIAAPAMGALFMVELALALMGRAAPQMNLMTMGFPIKIAVGFFFMGLLMTVLAGRMENLILDLGPVFTRVMTLGR